MKILRFLFIYMQTFFPSRSLYLYISDVFVALLYVNYSTAYLIVKLLTFRLCSFWKDIYNFNQHTHFVISYITFSESILVGIKNSMMTPQNRRLPQPPGMWVLHFLFALFISIFISKFCYEVMFTSKFY